MPDPEIFTDTDLTNMVRGHDAPVNEQLLEKLREQARERAEMEHSKDDHSLDALFRKKDKERNKDRGLEK